jgi:hypothetical protein
LTTRLFARLSGIQIVFAALLGTSAAFAIDPLSPRASDLHLKGPVKQMVMEETDHTGDHDTQLATTTMNVYSSDGRLLETNTRRNGTEFSVTKYVYDPFARVIAIKSHTPSNSDAVSEVQMKYDGQGRMSQASESTGFWGWKFSYDSNGLKQRTETYPVMNLDPNTAVGAVSWEGGYLSISRPSGGNTTTYYDEKDRPIRAEVRDAEQRVMMRIERTYDEHGRILEDKLSPENLDSAVPDQLRGEMNDAQRAAMAKFIGRSMAKSESKYTYDGKGNLIEVRVSRGMLGDEAWSMQYNDNDDITSEVSVQLESPDLRTTYEMTDTGKMIPTRRQPKPSPAETSTRFERRNEYAYDAHGNWTEMKSWTRYGQSKEWVQTQTVKRTLTYY